MCLKLLVGTACVVGTGGLSLMRRFTSRNMLPSLGVHVQRVNWRHFHACTQHTPMWGVRSSSDRVWWDTFVEHGIP